MYRSFVVSISSLDKINEGTGYGKDSEMSTGVSSTLRYGFQYSTRFCPGSGSHDLRIRVLWSRCQDGSFHFKGVHTICP